MYIFLEKFIVYTGMWVGSLVLNLNPTNFIQLFNNFKCTYENYQFIYTDGSKTENAVGCAALMGNTSLKEHLPSTSSLYTAASPDG